MTTFSPGDRAVARAWRLIATRPYLTASVLLHALLLGAWMSLPPLDETERAMKAADTARQDARQVAQTASRELQRRVEHMADIERRLAVAAGAVPAGAAPSSALSTSESLAALAARAQALSDAIDAAQRQLRAAALARLVGISQVEALHELDANASAESPPAATPAATPTQAIERLERHAREVLETQRAQLAARRDGVRVTRADAPAAQARPADGIPRSAVEQMASVIRRGPAQGRVGVVGEEGGRSVNRESVRGVAGGRDARADDPAPGAAVRFGDGPPVNVPGSSFDLTPDATGGRGDGVRYLRPPPIDTATLRTGAGRAFGPGGAFATRVYLDSWYVIGPFPGEGENPLAAVFPPEEDVDLDGAYRGIGGRLVTWKYASRGFYPFVLPDRPERAVYYAYTELRTDAARDLWFSIAADDYSMLWLDGRLVWTSAPGDKPWYHPPFYLRDEQVASLALAEGHRRVHLERGRHQLLVKVFNDRDRSFFSVVAAP